MEIVSKRYYDIEDAYHDDVLFAFGGRKGTNASGFMLEKMNGLNA